MFMKCNVYSSEQRNIKKTIFYNSVPNFISVFKVNDHLYGRERKSSTLYNRQAMNV